MSTDAGSVRSRSADNTAKLSWAEAGKETVTKANMDYKIIMPAVPIGSVSLNTLFLHANPEGRPYNVNHFGHALQDIVNKDDVSAFGVYQYNHVWAISFRNRAAKDSLLARKELNVKGQRCVIIEPNKKDIVVKIHWVPGNVPDEAIVRAFEAYGTVKEICREKWKGSFFEGIDSTTRQATIQLKDGILPGNFPHQTYIAGCQVLLAVQGRPPLCLRCKQIGHIRRQCNTPWCKTCRMFGHEEDECVKTYASSARQSHPAVSEQCTVDTEEVTLAGAIAESAPSESTPSDESFHVHDGANAEKNVCSDVDMQEAEATFKRKGKVSEANDEATGKSTEQRWSVGKGKRWKLGDKPLLVPKPVEAEASQLEDMSFSTT